MELKQKFCLLFDILLILLIVPYGIETIEDAEKYEGLATFNRTLWN